MLKVAVTSKSFSNSKFLRAKLLEVSPNCKFNYATELKENNDLVKFLDDCEAAIIGLDNINDTILKALPKLRYISKYGVGLNNIDLLACEKRGVGIGWTGGLNKTSVAEQVVCFMISLMRNIFFSSYKLKQGHWEKSGGRELSGKTIGIIGLGNIGKEVVRLLQPFSCDILYNDIVDQDDFASKYGLKKSTKKEIFSNADIITIHTPLDESTFKLVNAEILNLMKETSYLINTARGGIVDINAIKNSLRSKKIAGAAIDTFPKEPLSKSNESELLELENLICTPHIGGNSFEAINSLGSSAIKHLKNFLYKERGGY